MEEITKQEKKVGREKPVRIKRRDIDLISALKAAKAADREKGRRAPLLAAIGLAALVMAVGYLGVTLRCGRLAAENDALVQKLSDPVTVSQLEEGKQQRLRNEFLSALEKATLEDLNALSNADSRYSYLTESLFEDIGSLLGGEIALAEMSLDNDTLTLSLTAQSAGDAARFVKRLRETGLFWDISYGGFSADGETAAFEVVCYFAESAGGEE